MIPVNFAELFESFSQTRVAVVGDMMLDTYWWGRVDRISPEAPVPVVAIDHNEYRLGGAANVGLNLASLGAEVYMMSVIGDDADGALLHSLLLEKKIHTTGILKSTARITTNKIRIISRNQQMMRLDKEVAHDLDNKLQQEFIDHSIKQLEAVRPQLLIFEDYNKGLLTENVIAALLAFCKKNAIVTAVDPKRKNFFAYQGVDIFKPNLKEAYEALNITDATVNFASLQAMHAALYAKLGHRISYITLSEKGVFCEDENGAEMVPAHVRKVADVSGAGDTVIAVAALVYAATRNKKLMAEIGNLAGGIVCEEVGTVAIDKVKLLRECKELSESGPLPAAGNFQHYKE